MKNLTMMLIAFFLLANQAQGVEVDCGGRLAFEIETYAREGNGEGSCPAIDNYPTTGTELLSLNSRWISMFSTGPTRDYCTGVSSTIPSPWVFRGCLDLSYVNKTGTNTVTISITNENPETYVNVSQRAFLINGSSRIFLTSWSRQGKYPDHSFVGATTVTLSALVFSNSGPQAAEKIQNIDYMLTRLNELRILNDADLEKWREKLAAFLDIDARLVDLNQLGSDIPEWFKDLIRSVQQGQEQLVADLDSSAKDLENKKTANQRKIAASLEGLGADISPIDVDAELKIDQTDYSDEQLKAREQSWLGQLNAAIEKPNRPEFLQVLYAWEEESKTTTNVAIELNAEKPGYYSGFVSSQERILAFARKYVDENYFFRDVPISEGFKALLEGGFKLKNPELAKRIKEIVNLKYRKNAAYDKAITHLEAVSEEYVKGSDENTEKAQVALIDDILSFLGAVKELAECVAKTEAAGLYASFYEVYEGRGFCDDKPLDGLERGISFVDFSANVTSKLGIKAASAVSLVVTLRKMFRIAAPVFKKIGFHRISEVTEIIIRYSSKLKTKSLDEFLAGLKRIFPSAKKFGAVDSADMGSFLNLVSTIENAPAKNIVQFEYLKAALAVEEIKGAKVIGSALKDDPLHRSASFMLDIAAKEGKVTSLKGGDGVVRNLLQVEGAVDGKKGIFEWIAGPEGLTHQRFIKDGLMTGFPNQVPSRLP